MVEYAQMGIRQMAATGEHGEDEAALRRVRASHIPVIAEAAGLAGGALGAEGVFGLELSGARVTVSITGVVDLQERLL